MRYVSPSPEGLEGKRGYWNVSVFMVLGDLRASSRRPWHMNIGAATEMFRGSGAGDRNIQILVSSTGG